MPELSFCAWEQAFSQGGAVGDVLETSGVGNLFRHCRRVALQRLATAGGTTPSQHQYVAHITRDRHAHHARIGALLHDVGKLVLGFFFWDWMLRILTHRAEKNCSFRQAEVDLGDVASHQRVGQLLLNSDMGENAVNAVGNHHELSDPDDLLRLLHVADNLAKSVGLGTVRRPN
jgi:HD-like signal output (HDOD) protein